MSAHPLDNIELPTSEASEAAAMRFTHRFHFPVVRVTLGSGPEAVRLSYSSGVPDDGHPYDSIFYARPVVWEDDGTGGIESTIFSRWDGPPPSVRSEYWDAFVKEDDERERRDREAYEEVRASLPEGEVPRLAHVGGLLFGTERELRRLAEERADALAHVRDALAPLFVHAVETNEWSPHDPRPNLFKWSDVGKLALEERPHPDQPTLTRLHFDVGRAYQLAADVRPAADARYGSHGDGRFEGAVLDLGDRYRLDRTVLVAQLVGARRWLGVIASANDRLERLEALRAAASAVLSKKPPLDGKAFADQRRQMRHASQTNHKHTLAVARALVRFEGEHGAPADEVFGSNNDFEEWAAQQIHSTSSTVRRALKDRGIIGHEGRSGKRGVGMGERFNRLRQYFQRWEQTPR